VLRPQRRAFLGRRRGEPERAALTAWNYNVSSPTPTTGFRSFSSPRMLVTMSRDGLRRRVRWLSCASLSANKHLSAQSRLYCAEAVRTRMDKWRRTEAISYECVPNIAERIRPNNSESVICALQISADPQKDGHRVDYLPTNRNVMA
jgi:hypothetical protein